MSQPVEMLLKDLPALCEAFSLSASAKGVYESHPWGIPFNTFKTVAPVIVATAKALDCKHEAIEQEVCQLRADLEKAQQESTALREEVARLRESLDAMQSQVAIPVQEATPPPSRFNGWNVQTGKDGYIRLYRKVAGKVRTLHVGKVWDEAKAVEKVSASGIG